MGREPLGFTEMSDLRSFEAEFSRAFLRLERHTPYVDVLAESTEGESLVVDTKSSTPSRQPKLSGAVLRAWGTGRWVEVATSSLDPESIGRAAHALEDRLAALGPGTTPPGEPSTTRKEWADRPTHPLSEEGTAGMAAWSKDVLGWATGVPGIGEGQVRIGWSEVQRFFMNSAGARTYQLVPRISAVVVPLAMENGRVEFDAEALGTQGGREHLERITPERVTEVAKNAVALLHAKPPPTGEMSVVLDPSTTGTFAHESFGHGTEADQFVRDRSYLRPLLGEKVGPEFLTIADDGSLPGGWGTIYADDEGFPCRRTALVEHGQFVSGLHDRVTAAALGTRPTGNARRADFLSRLFVRMTNTYVEPGDWSLEELVEEAKNGVLLVRATSGIEDPQGGQMQIKVKKGRRIENGRLTELVTSMALSGKVLDFLREIRGVSRQAKLNTDPGFCGKGHTDLLPVGSGGPYLLSRAIVGPA